MLSDAANVEGKIFFANNLFIPSLRRLFLGLPHSGQKNCILLAQELFTSLRSLVVLGKSWDISIDLNPKANINFYYCQFS